MAGDRPVRDLRQHVGRAPVQVCLLPALRRLRAVRRARASAASATGSRPAFAAPAPSDGWALGGLTYASYNIIGAVVILPVVRHLTSDRDAIVAGRSSRARWRCCRRCCSSSAWSPSIPSIAERDAAVGLPAAAAATCPLFHLLFQLMIFAALLESGAGAVHAINERIDKAWQRRRGASAQPPRPRSASRSALLIGCMFARRPLRPRRADRQWLSRARLHLARRLRPAAADASALWRLLHRRRISMEAA